MKLSWDPQWISSQKLINPLGNLLCCATSNVKMWFSHWLLDTRLRSICIRFRFLINQEEKSAEGQFSPLCCLQYALLTMLLYTRRRKGGTVPRRRNLWHRMDLVNFSALISKIDVLRANTGACSLVLMFEILFKAKITILLSNRI